MLHRLTSPSQRQSNSLSHTSDSINNKFLYFPLSGNPNVILRGLELRAVEHLGEGSQALSRLIKNGLFRRVPVEETWLLSAVAPIE